MINAVWPFDCISLQSYFRAPTLIKNHGKPPFDWIRVIPAEQVLLRRARLSGADSARIYATAFSVIRPKLIPETFQQRLIDREIGIGVLIRDSGLESYREMLDVSMKPMAETNDATALGQSDIVFRTYRIIIEGEPVILITESFLLDLFK